MPENRPAGNRAKSRLAGIAHLWTLGRPTLFPIADIDDNAVGVILRGMTIIRDYLPSVPEPEAISFRYTLHERGNRASLDMSLGGQTFAIAEFGSTTDSFGDLVRAALQIATGESHVGVIFDEGPQRWGLAVEPAGLSPRNSRIVRVTIRDGGTSLKADGWSNRPIWKWSSQPILDGHVSSDDFARAVQTITVLARARYDDSTYRELWYGNSLEGFPLRALQALNAALAVPEYRE